MRGLSVVIPSKTALNVNPCLHAVLHYEPTANRIVVDDGVERIGPPLAKYVEGIKPFIFARNVNSGIKVAGDDDVVILNDDALLQTHGGLSLLQQAADEHPEYGIIAATTNVTGNQNQYPKGIGLREEPRTIPFICVLLPRRTIDAVGLMDERFGGTTADGRRIYGFCDNDYCRRVKNAGLKLAIHDGCFVDHGSLRSSFRGDPHAAGDISAARELYLEKWGDLN